MTPPEQKDDQNSGSGNDVSEKGQTASSPHHDAKKYLEEDQVGGNDPGQLHKLNLQVHNEQFKNTATILNIRSNAVSYETLRRQFWAALSRTYDVDGNGTYNFIEIFTMLDTIGSTLTRRSIEDMFTQHGRSWKTDELTSDELVDSLEAELLRVDKSGKAKNSSDESLNSVDAIKMDEKEKPQDDIHLQQVTSKLDGLDEDSVSVAGNDSSDTTETKHRGHVIQVRECPVCHVPLSKSKSQIDIVTHIATCARSNPKNRVMERFLMGGFYTEAYAQRKWFVKGTLEVCVICLCNMTLTNFYALAIQKFSYGKYKIGGVCLMRKRVFLS